MKDPVQFRLPSTDLLVIPRMKKSGNALSPTLFEDIPLDLRDDPRSSLLLAARPNYALLAQPTLSTGLSPRKLLDSSRPDSFLPFPYPVLYRYRHIEARD